MKTADDFLYATGRSPVDDDLERTNCEKAGTMGHMMCGWCTEHNKPRLDCGCWELNRDALVRFPALPTEG